MNNSIAPEGRSTYARPNTYARLSVTVLIVIVLTTATKIQAQLPVATIPRPQFDVATIKPAPPIPPDPTVPSTIACHGTDAGLDKIPLGTCLVNRRPLADVVSWAYGVQRPLIIGGPSWVGSDKFVVEAKAESPSTATYGQLRLMFQTLLADRFKLAFHRETKDVDGYVLVMAKNGPKLKEAAHDEPVSAVNANGFVTYRNCAIGRLVQFLSSVMGRPMVNQTGLTGMYDIDLTWTADGADPAADTPTGPSIFTALQEQLGLRLSSEKVPTETIVIDGAEKPPEN
jgi:uncharacterized protein (TIGR03435 family)